MAAVTTTVPLSVWGVQVHVTRSVIPLPPPPPPPSTCSDGWDRTAQVCGLVQVLLDPYARTLKGFASLVAKEWGSFGHKFQERLGHSNEKGYDYHEASPILLQWLDAVYQLVAQFPAAFEFNARTLLLVAHHAYSCRFGNFLFDCERERAEARLSARTPSLWGYLLHPDRVAACLNPAYDPSAGDVLLPHPSTVLRHVTLWSEWFLRWAPFPSLTHTSSRMERYPAAAYDAALLAGTRVLRPSAAAAARSPIASATSAGGFSPAAATPGGSGESSPVPASPTLPVSPTAASTPAPSAAGVGPVDANPGGGGVSARPSPVVAGEGEEEEEEEQGDGGSATGAAGRGSKVDHADAAIAHVIASAAASGRSSIVGGLGLAAVASAGTSESLPAGGPAGNGAASHPPAPALSSLTGDDAEAMVPTSTFLPSADMDGDLAGGEGDALPGGGGGGAAGSGGMVLPASAMDD
jgi:hypothetical protein